MSHHPQAAPVLSMAVLCGAWTQIQDSKHGRFVLYKVLVFQLLLVVLKYLLKILEKFPLRNNGKNERDSTMVMQE